MIKLTSVISAHQFGKRITIHSHRLDGPSEAVHAECDSVEHAIEIADDVVAQIAKRGILYVPTIDHNQYVEFRSEYRYHEKVAERLNAYIEKNLETACHTHKAGVKIDMGSDAVFF